MKSEIMRVNEREIVRIGIINWDGDVRGGEREGKSVCNGTAPINHTYPQNPPHNPYFAQNLHNFSLIYS